VTERAIVVCDYVKMDGAVTEFARLRPIFVAKATAWESVPASKLRERFPAAGTVYWSHPKSVKKGSAWIVSLSPSTVPVTSDRQDRFKVDEGHQLPLFVRRGTPADEVTLRRSIADSSLAFREFYPGLVYIRVPSMPSRWVGPFVVDSKAQGNARFHITFSSTEGFADVYEIPDAFLQPIGPLGHDAMTLAPGRTIGAPVDAFNVQSDESLLDSSLKSLRKIDTTVARGLELTKSIYQKYVDALEHAGLVGQTAISARARTRALESLFSQVEQDFVDTSAIAEALLSWPTVASRLDAAVEKKTTEVAEDIRRSAESRESAARLAATHAETEHAAATERKKRLDSQVRALTTQVQTLKKELNGFEGRLDESIREAGRSITRDPAQFLGPSILGRAILNATARIDTDHPFDTPLPAQAAPQLQLSTPKQLAKICRLHAEATGIDTNAVLLAGAMLASGCRVVLMGSAASRMSRVLADALAGGNRFSFPVPASVFGATDIARLAAVDPRTLNPMGIRFAEVLSRWGELGCPLLELCGADRAPLEVVLGDLTSASPTGDASFPRPHIVATLFRGPATFAMSANLRAQLAVVHCSWTSTPEPAEPTQAPTSLAAPNIDEVANPPSLPYAVMQICGEAGLAPRRAAHEIAMLVAMLEDESMALGQWMSARLNGLIDSTRLSALIDSVCGASISRVVIFGEAVREIQAAMHKE
jgi:hypothetical protein